MFSSPPCVAVLGGTGRHGRGLARRLAQAGARVIVGSRDPARAGSVVAGWRADAPTEAQRQIEAAENGAAIAGAEVVILAVPFASVAGILNEHRRQFRPGTLVIDVTVPVG